MRQVSLSWRRGHSVLALIALMTVQVWLINHFRTGLVGSDDMTAAFTGKRLVTEFDMTVAFTNLPMSMRTGMGLPLGVLQLVLPTDTALWVFPLLCALPLAPLSYFIARRLQLTRSYAFLVAAILSCTPAVIFNSSVALTEVPLLVVTLAAIACFVQALPRPHDAESSESVDESPANAHRWRFGWLFAAGACVGVLFTIKVSAVALAASLMGYAFLRQVSCRKWPTAAVTVGLGFAAMLGLEMGMWASMSGDPLYRSNRIRTALKNSQANMREIYRQTSSDDIMAKYNRYVSHFFGKRAQFGNLFLVFFAGWGLACVFARRYRLFLIMYGGPQLLYLWYLVTFYPSTQPRYAIQFLPFMALGTMLLLARWQWSRSGWVTAIVVVLVGQNLALGMKARSNQYRAETVFFPRYTYEKVKSAEAPVYVDARTVSIFHTLNNFDPLQEDMLWQYPIYRDMRVGERRINEKKRTAGIYPWRETNLDNAHGFVTVDLRLTRWLRRRLKSPKAIDVPPPNWILVDYAFPEKRPTLGGLIYYASPGITAEKADAGSVSWTGGSRWYRVRKGAEPVQVGSEIVKFQKGDLLVLGKSNITRPGLQFADDEFQSGDHAYAFLEFDCLFKPAHEDETLYIPHLRLFDGKETAARIRYPANALEAGRHTLRFPVRLSKQLPTLGFCLQFQQDCDVRMTVPRVFVQRLDNGDRMTVARYDGVEPRLENVVSLPRERTLR